MPQIPLGPFDPDDPNFEQKLKEISNVIEGIEGAKVDRNKMRAESRMIAMKHFIESLDDEQLHWLREEVGGLTVEGRDNYQTAVFYGVLVGMEWGRGIIEPEPVFAALDEMIGKAHYVQPVNKEGDEGVWEPERQDDGMTRPNRDDPDDAA